jgi:hypothetical protein
MTMVSSSYVMNHDLSQPKVVDLLVVGFTGTLQSWWEKHLTDESRASIRSAVKTNEEGIPIFNEKIGLGDSNAVNTLFYTIVEHFISTPSHLIYIYIYTCTLTHTSSIPTQVNSLLRLRPS